MHPSADAVDAPTNPRTASHRLSQCVIFHYQDEQGPNGSSMAAAIVTRVWTADMVNLTVFGDLIAPMSASSVPRGGSLHHKPGTACWTPDPEL